MVYSTLGERFKWCHLLQRHVTCLEITKSPGVYTTKKLEFVLQAKQLRMQVVWGRYLSAELCDPLKYTVDTMFLHSYFYSFHQVPGRICKGIFVTLLFESFKITFIDKTGHHVLVTLHTLIRCTCMLHTTYRNAASLAICGLLVWNLGEPLAMAEPRP